MNMLQQLVNISIETLEDFQKRTIEKGYVPTIDLLLESLRDEQEQLKNIYGED